MSLVALRRFSVALARRGDWSPGERCELCAATIGDGHRHVVDLGRRTICCSCIPCALLFEQPGAGANHYRTVPSRVCSDPEPLDERRWEALNVPVSLAFVFFNSTLSRWVVSYPGAAGATESELPLDEMGAMVASSRLLRAARPDVEALLVRGKRGGGVADALLVPIDACYDLVGLVRRDWKGFDGGDEVRRKLDEFFSSLRARSRPLPAEGSRA
ncbi:MAG TPA: DUF5947 family protein [Vulgatibacter sp.]